MNYRVTEAALSESSTVSPQTGSRRSEGEMGGDMGFNIFGASEKEIEGAKQSVVEALRRGMEYASPDAETLQYLRQRLPAIPGSNPESWASALVSSLITLVNDLRREIALRQNTIGDLRWKERNLERQVEHYRSDPLRDQVARLTEERDRWQREAEELGDRVQRLANTLDREKRDYEGRLAALREKVTSLRRIVVEQQEALNEMMT